MRITLKAARTNAGLTQEQAAEKIGVSQVSILKWEKGLVYPRMAHFFKACNVYGVNPNDVFLPSEFGEVKNKVKP